MIDPGVRPAILAGLAAFALQIFFWDDAREGCHDIIHDQYFELLHFCFLFARKFIRERSISLRNGFQLIIKIADQFAERHP